MDLFRNRDTTTLDPNPDNVPAVGSPDNHPGWFQECDLDNDMLGTPIGSYWLNMITAEIRNAIIDGDVSPLYTDWNQLKLAIRNTARRVAIEVYESYALVNPPPLVVRPSPGTGEFPDIKSALATMAGKFVTKGYVQLIDVQGTFPNHPACIVAQDNILVKATGPCSITVNESSHAFDCYARNVVFEGLNLTVTSNFSGFVSEPDSSVSVRDVIATSTGSSTSAAVAANGGTIQVTGSVATTGWNAGLSIAGGGRGLISANCSLMITPGLGGMGLFASQQSQIFNTYPGSIDIQILGGNFGLRASGLSLIDVNGEVSLNTAATASQTTDGSVILGA